MVNWRADGTLDYLGRRDQQIKLRGFRIELEEIETVLRKDQRVKDAAVIVSRAGAQEHLIGYVAADAKLDPEELRAPLENCLPAYMVPSRLIRLDTLPVTPNGKLDRRALADPTMPPRTAEPPRGQTESILSEIWAALLGLDAIDREASFFSIGGHSLLAVQLLARIKNTFGIELSLRELFEKPSLAGVSRLIDMGRNQTRPEMTPLPAGERPTPSFAQQRLMFLDQLEGPSAAYSMPATLELRGNLDGAALRLALAALVKRHDSLRLCFDFDDGRPIAHYLDAYDPLTELDLSHLSEEDAEAEAVRVRRGARTEALRSDTGAFVPSYPIALAPQRHRLLFNMHHIISDGWSIDLLIDDLARLYTAHRTGSDASLPAPALTYSSYARWQNQWLRDETLEREMAFWRDHLADAPELLNLQTDHPRPTVQVHEGGAVPLQIDGKLGNALRTLARETDATLFMVLLAAFNLLLFRFSGVRDISVGVPVANRGDSRLEDVVGLFLNTLVMRTQVPAAGRFRDFLSAIRQTTLAAYAHQDVPFEYLVEHLRPARSLSHNPLFQVMINLVKKRREKITLDGLEVEQTGPVGDLLAKFDLNLNFAEQPDGSLDGELQYNATLFEQETAVFLGDCFLSLLRGITAEPDALLTEISLYRDAPSAQRAMAQPAGPVVRFGSIELSIPHRFAEQVALHRDRIAVQTPTHSLTYGALDLASRCLAAALLEYPGCKRVALLLPHDTSMAVGILGTLQAGRTYVPLDSSQPAQRLRSIMDDVGAEVIVCSAAHEERAKELAGAGCTLLSLDRLKQVPAAPLPELSPDSIAYILYTSGSTGRPKGVVQNHRNVLHFIRRYSENLRLTPDDRMLQVASYAFDAAVMDFYGALLNGATLCLFDIRTQSITDCAPWLKQEGITVWHSTPSVFRVFAADLTTRLPSIRLIVMGGEAVSRTDFETFRQRFEPGTLFVNGLGPTESTVTLQFFADHQTDLRRQSMPVGYPVDGTTIELLDESGAPTDLFGEIAVCSPHIALGYWQQESAAFEADPARPGGIRYRSGDIARRLPDGSLEMVGRRDNQIKLRGFRIELGEIEAVLRNHPDIRDAAAILYVPEETAAEPRLIAYLTGSTDPKNALAWCREQLPSYMVPAAVVVLDALPLTVTGKLDRTALPLPDMGEQASADAPVTPGEELLAGLWADVLKTETIARTDSFFERGGHSLLATQLLSRIRAAFGADIPLRLIFEHPTLSAQATAIDKERRGTPPPPITPRKDPDTLPLSFAQQRLWFLAALEDGDHTAPYNITAALGLDAALDEKALRAALLALTARHESLRMTIRAENGQPVLGLRDPYDPLLVETLRCNDADRDAAVHARAASHAAAPFDLADDPLLRLTLLRLDTDAEVLLVNLHHIAADGWSLGVLVRDLSALYAAALEQHEADLCTVLPPLPIQYADYAAWQRDWLSGEVLETQLSYWRDRLAKAPALLELPTDHPRPAVKTYRGGQRTLTLEPELADRLEAFSRTRGATLFMTLLAAFKLLLHRYSGQEDILVGSPIANRTQAESEALVGFFVNTLVLRSTISRERSFETVLCDIRETALDAYAHQDIPFETVVSELQPERSLSHSPLFQVMFALQNAPQEALSLVRQPSSPSHPLLRPPSSISPSRLTPPPKVLSAPGNMPLISSCPPGSTVWQPITGRCWRAFLPRPRRRSAAWRC